MNVLRFVLMGSLLMSSTAFAQMRTIEPARRDSHGVEDYEKDGKRPPKPSKSSGDASKRTKTPATSGSSESGGAVESR